MPEPTIVASSPRKKSRPPPRPVKVAAIERVTPRVLRVAFTGPDLASFAESKPGAHMKLFFAAPGWTPADTDAPRPTSRTYTPRSFDAATGRLDVEFVRHGAGVASDWVETAKLGDPLHVGGPGGGYPIPDAAREIVIIADDTAMPAAGMILEALPPGCRATILCEVEDGAEERALSPRVASAPVWLYRAPNGARPGSLLEAAAAALPAPPADAYFWVACEAGAMRRIRDALIARGVDRARLHTRGYWKYGDTNYPDHDYGAD